MDLGPCLVCSMQTINFDIDRIEHDSGKCLFCNHFQLRSSSFWPNVQLILSRFNKQSSLSWTHWTSGQVLQSCIDDGKRAAEKRCVNQCRKGLSKKKWFVLPSSKEFEMILDGSMEIGLIYHGNRPCQATPRKSSDFKDRLKQQWVAWDMYAKVTTTIRHLNMPFPAKIRVTLKRFLFYTPEN